MSSEWRRNRHGSKDPFSFPPSPPSSLALFPRSPARAPCPLKAVSVVVTSSSHAFRKWTISSFSARSLLSRRVPAARTSRSALSPDSPFTVETQPRSVEVCEGRSIRNSNNAVQKKRHDQRILSAPPSSSPSTSGPMGIANKLRRRSAHLQAIPIRGGDVDEDLDFDDSDARIGSPSFQQPQYAPSVSSPNTFTTTLEEPSWEEPVEYSSTNTPRPRIPTPSSTFSKSNDYSNGMAYNQQPASPREYGNQQQYGSSYSRPQSQYGYSSNQQGQSIQRPHSGQGSIASAGVGGGGGGAGQYDQQRRYNQQPQQGPSSNTPPQQRSAPNSGGYPSQASSPSASNPSFNGPPPLPPVNNANGQQQPPPQQQRPNSTMFPASQSQRSLNTTGGGGGTSGGPATIAGEPLHDMERAISLLKSSKFYAEGTHSLTPRSGDH